VVAPPLAVLLVRAVLCAPFMISAAGFLTGAFFAIVGLTGAFLAGAFFTAAFFIGAFLAGAFLATADLAIVFFTGAFLALAGDFLAVDFWAVDFWAVDFWAGAGFFLSFATAEENFFFNATMAKAKGFTA